MKILLVLLALINGGYMLADGIYVLMKGKYIGPEKPGPWAALFEKMNVNVFQLGPMFVVFGIAWLVFAYAVWTGQPSARSMGIVLSLLTLWYLPFGTLISVIVLIMVIIRHR
jgi:hypothetical protein